MAGQTNCWILPEGDYGAYKGLNSEIFILTARSARNLAYQDKLPKQGEAELLLSLKGQDLIGVPLKVSHALSSLEEMVSCEVSCNVMTCQEAHQLPCLSLMPMPRTV